MGRADDSDDRAPLVGLRGLRAADAPAPRTLVVDQTSTQRADAPPKERPDAPPPKERPDAPPPKERADAARNRERILKAARRLMRRKSLDTICMDAIAEAAGVGKGTLYRRFPDRGALAHALLDEDARLLQDRALAGFDLPPGTSSVDHALTLLGELFDFALDHASVLVAAQMQHREARYDHPAYVWQRTLLIGHLREATKKGEIGHVDALVTAELMLAGISPELVTWITEAADETRVRRSLLETWRRALRPA